MAQVTFDDISATRRLKDAGFAPEQAEAVVQIVTRANSLTTQIVQDLADVKAHISDNMATKWDLDILHAENRSGVEGLRSEMIRMIWLQGGALSTLILGLAGIMVGLAL